MDRSLYEEDRSLYEEDPNLVDILFYNQRQLDYFFRLLFYQWLFQ